MTDEEKWQAVAAKDSNADGKFFYSVKTTGTYCLPSCRSRPPLRKNVAFHDTAEAAEKAGFRACKRCRPTGPSKVDLHEAAVAKACRLIESAEDAPTLEQLSKAAGMAPYYFHRTFKAITGVTPVFVFGSDNIIIILLFRSESTLTRLRARRTPLLAF
jgi:AraC family transcriptional regulator of adaptative response/methylated-DNA-[protein]-cysteine methyltransferase